MHGTRSQKCNIRELDLEFSFYYDYLRSSQSVCVDGALFRYPKAYVRHFMLDFFPTRVLKERARLWNLENDLNGKDDRMEAIDIDIDISVADTNSGGYLK